MKLPSLPDSFLSKPIAHRGLHGGDIPENSPAAFDAAIDAGYGIELDLQLSADGEAMVFHDYDLSRLTNAKGPIQRQTVVALRDIRLENGEGIPTLPEVLELVAGKVPLLIELKDQDGALGPDVGRLENRTAALLKAYVGPVAVMSFNPHSVNALKAAAPAVPRGLATGAFAKEDWGMVPLSRLDELSAIPDFDATGASFISHNHRHLNQDCVAEIKETDAKVLCWTIKSPEEAARARQCSDNITFEGYLP